jgi:hypothetical protein
MEFGVAAASERPLKFRHRNIMAWAGELQLKKREKAANAIKEDIAFFMRTFSFLGSIETQRTLL